MSPVSDQDNQNIFKVKSSTQLVAELTLLSELLGSTERQILGIFAAPQYQAHSRGQYSVTSRLYGTQSRLSHSLDALKEFSVQFCLNLVWLNFTRCFSTIYVVSLDLDSNPGFVDAQAVVIRNEKNLKPIIIRIQYPNCMLTDVFT